jgi:RNA polymerase sigma-70 factor (ECF subfamily)
MPLYKVLYRMVRNRDDAEDLVEEAFIKAYRAISRFDLNRSFFAWICRIAVNNAINYIKKERRGQVQSIGMVEYRLTAKKGNPVKMTREKILRERINVAIAKLPEEYRMILVLRVDDEYSYEEISNILKIPKGTVMSRLARARQKLKNLFNELEVQEK